jgi:hypothetical protein
MPDRLNPRRRPGATVEYPRAIYDDAGRIKPLSKRIRVRLEEHGHATPCWIVGPHCSPHTYATVITTGGQALAAHRYVWAWQHAREIPVGMVVHHECFSKRCVNPDHLALCTLGRNTQLSNFGARVVALRPQPEEKAA